MKIIYTHNTKCHTQELRAVISLYEHECSFIRWDRGPYTILYVVGKSLEGEEGSEYMPEVLDGIDLENLGVGKVYSLFASNGKRHITPWSVDIGD